MSDTTDKDDAEMWVNDVTLVLAVLGAVSINPMREFTDEEHADYRAAVARLADSTGLSKDSPVVGKRLFLPGSN